MHQDEMYQTRTAVNPRVQLPKGTQKFTRTAIRSRKRHGKKMALFGAMSIASYALLFTNESLVTQTFTMGGWHAAFPVATAFFFSFIHGAFASSLLSFIGLEAKPSFK